MNEMEIKGRPTQEEVDGVVNQLSDILVGSAKSVIGKRQCGAPNKNGWYDPHLVKVIKARHRLTRRVYKLKEANNPVADELEDLCSRIKAWERQEIKRLKQKQWSLTASKLAKSSPERVWQFARQRRARSDDNSSPVLAQALSSAWAAIGDPSSESQDWDANFKVMISQQVQAHLESPWRNNDEFGPEEKITEKEVQHTIARLELRKAAGPDETWPFMLKWAGQEGILAFTRLFNWIWRYQIVPQDWKEARIIPLLKGGSPSDPTNYRPISLTSVLGKCMTRIVSDRVSEQLEGGDILADNQGGFRPLRGCLELVLTVNQIVWLRKVQRLRTYLAFIDVNKAYDTVWRDGLWAKLWDYGFQGRAWSYLHSLYQGDRSYVQMGKFKSSWFSHKTGVRQGDVASPMLYSLFINELVEEFKAQGLGVPIDDGEPVGILLFADDICLLAPDQEQLQRMLDIVSRYADRWRFRINQDKSNVMVIGTANEENEPAKWLLQGHSVKETNSYKYLGIWVRKDGLLTAQLAQLMKNVMLTVGNLETIGVPNLLMQTSREFILGQVAPVIEWGIQVCPFSVREFTKLENAWISAVKRILKLPRYASREVVQADLGIMPLKIRRAMLIANLYHHIAGMGQERIVKRVFCMGYNAWVKKKSRRNWFFAVDEALTLLNLPDLAHMEGAGEIPRAEWKGRVKKSGMEAFHREWNSACEKKEHLRLLQSCVEAPGVADFLKGLTSTNLQRFGLLLRSNSLPLANCKQTAKYARIGGSQASTTCQMCKNGEEDLSHFLDKCSVYESIKQMMFSKMPNLGAAMAAQPHQLVFKMSPELQSQAMTLWHKMWQFRHSKLEHSEIA